MCKKVSIVTPSYNQGEFVGQTIQSVIDQYCPNLEYIIIDGGSLDDSVETIKKYEKELKYWISEQDRGQSHAINKGLVNASGDIFNWLCSDDYFEPGALNAVAHAFEDPETRLVSARFNLVNVEDPCAKRVCDSIRIDDTLEKTFARIVMSQPAVFWRLGDIKLFGGINERLHYLMDLELILKYLLYYGTDGIKCIDDVIVSYRIHPSSKTAKKMDHTKMRPDSAFNIDKNTIFYFLAIHYGAPPKTIDAIETLMDYVDKEYSMSPLPENPKVNVLKAIDYYLYDFARRYFYGAEKQKAWDIVWKISASNLSNSDAKGLKFLRRKLLFWKLVNIRN